MLILAPGIYDILVDIQYMVRAHVHILDMTKRFFSCLPTQYAYMHIRFRSECTAKGV